MNRKMLAVFPAAMIPAVIVATGKLQVPDTLAGMIVGVLIGLALLAFRGPRRCPPSPA